MTAEPQHAQRLPAGYPERASPLTVLYFGTYDRDVGRNAVLVEGLRAVGVRVSECWEPLWSGTSDKIRSVRSPASTAAVAPRVTRAWVRLLRRHASAPSYDAMVVGATAHLDLPLARALSRRRRRPLVFDPLVSIAETVADRGLLSSRSIRFEALVAAERRLFRLPDLCLSDTAVHARAIASQMGMPERRWSVVPAGAPSVYRRCATPYAAPAPGPFRVVYFGQYIPLHGVDVMMAAAARLRARADIAFEFVGTGQTLDLARRLAAELELERARFVPRWLGAEELAREHVARADVCLGIFGRQPKAARVVPYKVYTALASGRAAITGDTPAVREILAPGGEVVAVPPGDADALASAIADLADHPSRVRDLARAGQSAYDDRFACPVLGARLRDILADGIGAGRHAT